MNYFVKDVFGTVQGRVAIFGMQVDDNMLYRCIAQQISTAYSLPFLSNFLSFYT